MPLLFQPIIKSELGPALYGLMALAGGTLLNATPPSHSQPIPMFSLPTFTFKFLKADQSSPVLMVLFLR